MQSNKKSPPAKIWLHTLRRLLQHLYEHFARNTNSNSSARGQGEAFRQKIGSRWSKGKKTETNTLVPEAAPLQLQRTRGLKHDVFQQISSKNWLRQEIASKRICLKRCFKRFAPWRTDISSETEKTVDSKKQLVVPCFEPRKSAFHRCCDSNP